ncbi:MAG: iron-containing alcohol dehydrogenase, partial [Chitinophagales bacterium]
MDVATQFPFNLRTRVSFGVGAFANVAAEAAAFGRTALLVTGRGAMRRSGVTERLVRQLSAAGARAVLYEEASPNPTTVEVDRGADLARAEGALVIVGLGGGSAMDVAKGIAQVLANGKPCYELCGTTLERPGPPVIAVPTTSGTGSEVNGVAVVTEPARKHKTSLRGPAVGPARGVGDPELSRSRPAPGKASAGVDAQAPPRAA